MQASPDGARAWSSCKSASSSLHLEWLPACITCIHSIILRLHSLTRTTHASSCLPEVLSSVPHNAQQALRCRLLRLAKLQPAYTAGSCNLCTAWPARNLVENDPSLMVQGLSPSRGSLVHSEYGSCKAPGSYQTVIVV